jgi:hypothetical protein
MTSQIKYSADGYATEYLNEQRYYLNTTTANRNITLYNILSNQSTNFYVKFKDINFIPVNNAVVQIWRKYISEGVYKLVEASLTDIDGNALVHLDKNNNVIYSILILKNGELLSTTSSIIPICQDFTIGTCQININQQQTIDVFNDYNTYGNLKYYLSFNKTSRKITTYFSSTDGNSVLMFLNATILDNIGNKTACSVSYSASFGSFDCVIPDSVGNTTIKANLYKNGELITTEIFSIPIDKKSIFGYDNFILSFLLIISLALMMVSSLVGMIIGVFLGVIVSVMLMFIDGGTILGSTSALIWLFIAGGIIIWKLTKMRGGE